MRRSGFLPRKTELKRTSALKRTRLRRGRGFRRYADQDAFRESVLKRDGLSRPCVVGCGRVATDAHHLIPKRALAAYGLSKHAADPRNGVALCRAHHEAVERRALVITFAQLPPAVHDFVTELGPPFPAKLERIYPKVAA